VASEPALKRAIVFVDGQNLFCAARTAFGYRFPNYDIRALADAICQNQGWQLTDVRFYTGIPDRSRDAFSHHFWTAKLAQMGRDNITIFSRPLRYRNEVGSEKGIDVRLAIDVIRLALRGAFDVALVISQDQDLSEVAKEIRAIAKEQDRWIRIASAFVPRSTNRRGINGTDWIIINRSMYDSCLDSRDYRRKKTTP
jgi:uncharacterized LabA/DUF88 family protein